MERRGLQAGTVRWHKRKDAISLSFREETLFDFPILHVTAFALFFASISRH